MKRLLLFLCFIPFGLKAQYEINGRVADTDQTPLEYANVLLFKAQDSLFVKGAVSELDGSFAFKDIEAGAYFLTATVIGFREQSSAILTLPATEKVAIDFTLSADSELLEAVEVVAKKPLFEQQIDRTVVNVQNSVTAAGATALQVLERSPGIQVDRMNGDISMRGKGGVIVMLNGKRMRMDSRALIQFLENLSADQIEKIELIATPPASYDAEGDAGIIDIRLIKKEEEGGHAQLNLNGGYSRRGKLGGSLNFNYRKKRVNVFGNLSASQDYTLDYMNIQRSNEYQGEISRMKIDSRRPAFTGIYNGRLGVDVQLSKKTIIGALFTGYHRHWTLDALTQTSIQVDNGASFTSELEANEINDWTRWLGNFNIRHNFDNGNQLSFDIDILDYKDYNPVTYQERNFNAEGQLTDEIPFTSSKSTPIKIRVAKLDYHLQWSKKLQFQTGLKATHSTFTNDIEVNTFEGSGWIEDPRFTNVFEQDEKIGAAYVSTDYQFTDQLKFKAGLRYEYYDSELTGQNEGPILQQQFGRLFPTLFTSYQIDDDHQLQLSYNERITRPAFTTIAPAFFFWGYNTILAGNPTVRPTISRQISASISHKRALINLQYSDDDQPLGFQPEQIPEDNVVLTKVVNMADRKTAMISLNTPITITSWWESRYNVSGFWQRTVPIFEDQTINRETVYCLANATQSFQLPKDFSIEATANWRSRLKWGLGTLAPIFSMNLGLQKAINSRTKVSLNWNDVLNWGSFFRMTYDQPQFNLFYDSRYDFDGNIVRVSVSWQLGNDKVKKGGTRATGSEEESGRLN